MEEKQSKKAPEWMTAPKIKKMQCHDGVYIRSIVKNGVEAQSQRGAGLSLELWPMGVRIKSTEGAHVSKLIPFPNIKEIDFEE